MKYDEAKQILLYDTLNDDGLYVHLRLGRVTALEQISRLRYALRVLWRSLSNLDQIPCDVAFSCAIIIHFREECYSNLRRQNGTLNEDFDMAVGDLALGAFDILAGEHAKSWMVVRPDLGEIKGSN